MGGEFDFPALASDDVDGAGGETDADAASDVAEEDAHQSAATAADGHAVGVTFIVVLFLDHFAFDDFDIAARGAVGIDARVTDGDDAHLDGDEAAVKLDAFEGEVHVGLATEEGEIFGFLDGADDAVNAGAGGEKDAAVESDGLGENGDEGIAFMADGAADGSEEREVDFCALDELARLGVNGCGKNGRNGDYKN